MAKMQIYTGEELTTKLEMLAAFAPQVACKMLDAAAVILEKQVKSQCSKHQRTGVLVKSIRKTKARKTKDGTAYIVLVRPTGTTATLLADNGKVYQRDTPVSTMKIMAHLELGTSKFPPIPIISKAVADAEPACMDAMYAVFDQEVEKL